MNNYFFKKNILRRKTGVSSKGFTLLVAIVTTSLLLIVSFVVINVAIKQLVISRSNQESQYSYYNAESGIECAIYWDLKNPSGNSAFATDTAPTIINCNGQSITGVGGGGYANATTTFVINNMFPKGCVIVKVGKVPEPPSSYGITRIESYGYNTDCAATTIGKYERGVTITY